MKNCGNKLCVRIRVILLCLGILMGNFEAFALVDNAALISVSIQPNTQMMPRTMFTQTWTLKNTGTTTWSPGASGYTLNLVGKDSLGALPLFTNTYSTWYIPSAIIGSGKSVAPGATATFSISFIAPEAPGLASDIFQLNGTTNFGPPVTVQIVVQQAGSANQYDRCMAVSYANNYAGVVCSDGYFWTNGSSYGDFGAGAPVPTNVIGDDCAHFVSCCIGSQSAQRGGGLKIPSRVSPTYGEPGAGRLINTVLIGGGYATEVFSLSQMSPGDLIGWNWEGDTNITNIDHVTLYLGKGLVASHAVSALDVSTLFFQDSSSDTKSHLIHIFDAPTILTSHVGTNFILSWGTNWTGYAMYSSTSLSPGATWTKVSKSPVVKGTMNVLTNGMSQGPMFYRLVLP